MPFEKGLFYLPCPNQVDDMPPSLRVGITPTKGGMVGMHPYLMRRHTTRFVPTMATLKLIIKNQ